MAKEVALREQLLILIERIRAARDHKQRVTNVLAEFERALPGTDVDNLCNSDWDNETIVDYCLGERGARRKSTRAELVLLVKRLLGNDFSTDAEASLAVTTFDFNCVHPGRNGLIFYPEEYFDGRADPSPEEIVDKAVSGV